MAPLFLNESDYLSSSDDNSCATTIESKNQPQDAASYSKRSLDTASENHKTNHCRSKEDDVFLYYSNDEVRMKTLKLEDRDATTASNKIARHQRKTRLSFEADPLLVLEDDLEEMFGDDECDFSDIDFSHLKNGHNDSKIDLLSELLQM